MRILLALLLYSSAAAALQPTGVAYDIVYVRQPRQGDQGFTWWPEVFHPARLDPGADLMLLHPDGSEELLVAGGNGSVTDPVLSFDGQRVYFARFADLRPQSLNSQRDYLPLAGADIWQLDLPTRQLTQLTHGEFTPNTASGHWLPSNPVNPPESYNRLGYGILNLGPMPLPDGRIAFTSNRNGFVPPKGYTTPTLQLYVMDSQGENVEAIAPMSISSALHPTVLQHGELIYSSHEAQGLRDPRLWGIWGIQPDGRGWRPVISAFHDARAFHFMTQISDGRIVAVDYYNLNNSGFGTLVALSATPSAPAFHSALLSENPDLPRTLAVGPYPFRMTFTPRGMQVLTPFTHPDDEAAPIGAGGQRVGKFTHPSGAPGNDLLVVWSPGPVNHLDRPTPFPRIDAGLYRIAGSAVIDSPGQLQLIKNDPNYNEVWPRAVVPYAAIHGVPAPASRPWLPNDGSADARLPEGTPYGLVGSSSVYKRESFPGYSRPGYESYQGLDAFNTAENEQSPNWATQGADAGRYSNSEIWALRVVAMEPNTHRSYGPNEGAQFYSHANERLRILGEIPLRKHDAQGQIVLDPEGNPDTSFLFKLPADTPFTFQLLDRRGMLLSASQTWHQLRPGEKRVDCGGCHAHSQAPLDFAQTAAAAPDFPVSDLGASTPLLVPAANGDPGLRVEPVGAVNVEFVRDIRPLLQRSCVSCHSGSTPAGALNLADLTAVGGLPGDYYRLAADTNALFGYPPLIGSWRQTNTSRYVRAFQSRRSLLIWKLYGQRLDGWSNADHPTESVPGNVATLPAGADPSLADLDYTGAAMPPPGASVPPLSEEEKLRFARWIDLGAPIDTGSGSAAALGWMLDEIRPTLTLSTPRAGTQAGPLRTIDFGMADAYSGIDAASLDVRADFAINGRPAGSALADLAQARGDGRYRIVLNTPLLSLPRATVTVSVADRQGNVQRIERRFALAGDSVFADGFNP
ncbi:MAG: hypothetical protein U1F26_12280 [Lysobacterales bacterium]